eukprot:71446_1
MFWLLVVFILQHHLFECYGYNDSINCSDYYNATTICRINCDIDFDCNNHKIYCPNYGKCIITTPYNSFGLTLTNTTIYCGYLGLCIFDFPPSSIGPARTFKNITIHANDSLELYWKSEFGYGCYNDINIFGANIENLTYKIAPGCESFRHFIYAPNAKNILFQVIGYHASNVTIIADYAKTIVINCYGEISGGRYPDYDANACYGINVEASSADTLRISCSTRVYNTAAIVYGCYDFNINAVNANHLYIDTISGTINSLNNSIINASNTNSVDIACSSGTCQDIILFCSANNCAVSGSLHNLTLYALETEKLILLQSYLYRSTIYANYTKHVNINGTHSDTIIYATNASIVDYNTTDGRGTDIYASNALNVTFSAGGRDPGYSGNIFVENVNVMIVKCDRCADINIYGEYINFFHLTCNKTIDPYYIYICKNINAYLMNAQNIMIEAYNSNAFIGSNVYASNAHIVNVECISYTATQWGKGVCVSNFHLSNANNIIYKCLGRYSCGATNAVTIDAENAQNVYFYAIGTTAVGVGANGYTQYVLDTKHANNVSMVFDNNNTEYSAASSMIIYPTENKNSSMIIHCNGKNSCGWLNIYSMNGIKDINLTFNPKCKKCGNDTSTSTQSKVDYGCFSGNKYYIDPGMYMFCGANYSDRGYFASRKGNLVLCDSSCCKGSEFYGSKKSCDPIQSFFQQYKEYIITGIVVIVIFLACCLRKHYKKMGLNKNKNQLLNVEMEGYGCTTGDK